MSFCCYFVVVQNVITLSNLFFILFQLSQYYINFEHTNLTWKNYLATWNNHFTHADSFSSFCESETFKAACPPSHVILMTLARYGRMQISKCVQVNYGHVGCVSDVLTQADARCSGRQKCDISVPDAEFASFESCPSDLKSYLEAGYRCVRSERVMGIQRTFEFILHLHLLYFFFYILNLIL